MSLRSVSDEASERSPNHPATSLPSVILTTTKHGSVQLKIRSHPVGMGLMERNPSHCQIFANPSRCTSFA